MKPATAWFPILGTLVLLLSACVDTSPPAGATQTLAVLVATPTHSAPGPASTPPAMTPTPCIPCKKRGAGEPDLVITRPLVDQRGAWTHYVNANSYRVVLSVGDAIWAGTDQGLFRWDDQGQWQRFTTQDGLPSNQITALACSTDGTLWVGTDKGVARRTPDGAWAATTTPAGVRSLVVDSQDRVWIALDEGEGLARLDADGQLRPIAKQEGFSDNDAYVVSMDVLGRIWCGTPAGVSIFTLKGIGTPDDTGGGSTWHTFAPAEMDLRGDEPVTDIALDGQGQAWARAGESVAYYDGTGWTAYPTIYEAVAATFEAVRGTTNPNGLWHVDVGGNVWVQGVKRVEIYDGERWSPQPFTAYDARAIASDTKGHLWLGAADGAGLLRVTPEDERILYVLNGPPANQIVAVAAAGDRTVWCGTIQASVGVLALAGEGGGETWTVYDAQNSPLQAPVIDRITTDLTGAWFAIAGSEQLYRFRDDRWMMYETVWQVVESEYVILVATAGARGLRWLSDDQGNVWAWEGAHLGRYDGAAWQRYEVPGANGDGAVNLTRVARDTRGRLWCGTYGGGVGVFDPQTEQWTFHTPTNSDLESGHVADVLIDVAGNVWLSTRVGQREADSGLYRIAPDGTWRRWGKADGLPSLDLGDLVADGRGRVWVACTRGLARVDEKGMITAFTAEDGLLSNRVTSLALDGAGRLWIGTWDGLCRYDPNVGE